MLPDRPNVPVTLQLEPEAAVPCVTLRLWDGLETSIFENVRFDAGAAVLQRSVPAGQYVLTVAIEPPTPPYRAVPALPVPALPPRAITRVKVG